MVSIVIGGWVGMAYVQSQMVELPKPEPKIEVIEAIDIPRITYYQAVWWQTDDTPNISSCGPNIESQIAVSRDLMGEVVNCGDSVEVWSDKHGLLGTYTVWDVTNERFSKTIDILFQHPPGWGKTSGYMILGEK